MQVHALLLHVYQSKGVYTLLFKKNTSTDINKWQPKKKKK